ncbi:MAG: PKD domain-containing protein [Promethearchaeota archaeon]
MKLNSNAKKLLISVVACVILILIIMPTSRTNNLPLSGHEDNDSPTKSINLSLIPYPNNYSVEYENISIPGEYGGYIFINDKGLGNASEIFIATANSTGQNVLLFVYNGSEIVLNSSISIPKRTSAITVGDYDNDGADEILVGVDNDPINGSVYAYSYADGTILGLEDQDTTGQDNIETLFIQDFDNDSNNEVLIGFSGGTNRTLKRFEKIGLSFSEEWGLPTTFEAGNNGTVGTIVGGVTNDGQDNIVVCDNDEAWVLYANGTLIEKFTFDALSSITSFWRCSYGDLLNDGENELLIYNNTNILIYKYNISSNLFDNNNNTTKYSGIEEVTVADIDNDLSNELIIGTNDSTINIIDDVMTSDDAIYSFNGFTQPHGFAINGLKITDTDGDSENEVVLLDNETSILRIIKVNMIPVAQFSVNVTSIEEGEWVQFNFTGNPGNPVTSYEWNFGDGSSNSTEQNPKHQYLTNGNYSVSLLVVDGDGDQDLHTEVNLITVIRATPPDNNTDGDEPPPPPPPAPQPDYTVIIIVVIIIAASAAGGRIPVVVIISRKKGRKEDKFVTPETCSVVPDDQATKKEKGAKLTGEKEEGVLPEKEVKTPISARKSEAVEVIEDFFLNDTGIQILFVKEILNITDEEFEEKIKPLLDKYNFTIEDEFIMTKDGDVDAFITELDEMFGEQEVSNTVDPTQ